MPAGDSAGKNIRRKSIDPAKARARFSEAITAILNRDVGNRTAILRGVGSKEKNLHEVLILCIRMYINLVCFEEKAEEARI